MSNQDFEHFKHPAESLANDAKHTIELVQYNTKRMSDDLSIKTQRLTSAVVRYINQACNAYKRFWKEHPLLTGFVTIQFAFAAIPLALFGTFCAFLVTATVFVASTFVAFWIVIASWILFGILCATFFLGSVLSVWCFGAYFIYNMFLKKENNNQVASDDPPLLYGKQLTHDIDTRIPESPKESVQDSGYDERSVRTEQTPRPEVDANLGTHQSLGEHELMVSQ